MTRYAERRDSTAADVYPMLKELAHFARHAPKTSVLAWRLAPVDLYDEIMVRAEAHGMAERRRWLAGGLDGAVLEIGSGTGLMFGYYDPAAEITAIEPDATFRARSTARADRAAANTTVRDGSAEDLPFAEAEFDAVVASFVLCSVASVGAVLKEVRRVLKPGGIVRMLEHVCSDARVSKQLMHVFNPVWRALNRQGCNMNRTVLQHFGAAGLKVQSVTPDQLWVPGLPAFPLQRIQATL